MTTEDLERADGSLARQLEQARRELAELNARVEKFQGLVDGAGWGITVGNPAGTAVEFANPAFAAMHGYTVEEVHRVPTLELFAPECRASVAPNIQLAHERGHHLWESRHVRKDGSTFPVLIDVTTVRGDAGQVLRRIVCVQDISARKQQELDATEAARRLNDAERLADAGSWEWDAVANESRWSAHLYQLFGVPPGTRDPGNNEAFSKLLHPEDRAQALAALAKGLQSAQGPFSLQYRIVRPDGAVRHIDARCVVDRDEHGRPLRMRGTSQDVTARRAAEDELRQSQARLKGITDATPDAIFLKDRDGRWLFANPATLKSVGKSLQQVLGKTDLEIHDDPEIARALMAVDRRVLESGVAEVIEETVRGPDGDHFYLAVKAPFFEDGRIVGVVGTAKDIGDRKRAKEALQTSVRNYKALLDALPDVVTRRDRAGRILFISDNVAKATNLAPAHFLGKTSRELGYPEEQCRLIDQLVQTVFATRAPLEGEFRAASKSGPTLWNTRLIPECDGQGVVQSVLSISRDVTAQHEAAEEKLALEGQLRQAQKMESVGRLAGGVAHDFNNTLAVILGTVEVAAEQVEEGSLLRQDLEEIRKAAKRSADLTRQLLAFARKQTVVPRVLNLNETVAGMLKMLQRLIGENINLRWIPDPAPWPVRVDPSQLDQLLANLCVNARDAIATVGTLTIQTENRTLDEQWCAAHADAVPGDYLRLAVTDDGCGMDAQTLSHLFEPFFTTKPMGKGTGLGLATVYGIVRQNLGSIAVRSEPGRGTTIELFLPRHVSAAGKEHPGAPPEPAARGAETILVVDDEVAVLKVMTRILSGLGYVVLCASSAAEALRVAREHPGELHLLVTDVIMPEMNGRDLADRLRALRPALKRLFVSGHTADVIAEQGTVNEGLNFIQKPFTVHELATKARQALDGAGD